MRYKEVIRPPLWLICFLYFLFLSLVLSVWAALGNSPALIIFCMLTILLIIVYFRSSMVIEVTDNKLRIGHASIDLAYMGQAQALNSEQVKRIRTRDADPAAYLAIRFWCSKAVRVEITDTRDSTPYWLISSNRGEELAKALKS